MGHPGRTLLRFSILFPYLALLALSSFTAADDAAVMAKLLAALNPAPSGWSASIDPCNWKDVTCLSGRVTNINLFSQSLSGTLPSDLGSLTQLTVLSLQGNSFSGPIPSLANLSLLQQLYLDNNKFTSIPAGFFQGLTSLQILTLSANAHLEPWTIPIELTQARSLVILYASGASVVGPLPDVFDSFPSLNDLRLSNNNLTGTLPKSLGGSAIQNLSLDNQVIGLSGTIDVLSSMTQLSRAWLQYNQFTGAIPDSLATLPSLRLLYLANNNLTGPIPKFATTVEFTSSSNPLLETTTASSGRGGEASISAGTIAGIVIAVVIFAMVVLFLSIKCYVGRRHKKYGSVENPENEKEGRGDLSDLHVFEGGNVTVSIQVLRQATNNFSEENILGKGGFGVVYKGELQDGTKIAVKKMEIVTDGSRGVKEFRAEISVLTKVRHKHLVALLGYCVNGNERLLVYEYMPRGNLSHHLFGWHERGYTSLTWKQRVTIALDVARGLEYLHSSTQQSFIHRDLKPSNILLGDDMRAKVSDFGLVKNLPDGNHSLETRLAGTFGYLAPEYGETGRVTTKTDVYAFGVVLTVLITGKKAVLDSGLDEKSHLVTWFLEVLKEKEDIPKAIDQTLDLDEETMESIHKVIELAGHCTARSPSERPNMGHAVSILSPLVEQWKPSCQEVKKSHSFDLTFKPSSSFTQTESSIESFGSMQPR